VRRVFISDCEGPISKNDNAFEITKHCIPDGGRFFAVISRYDDILADVLKRSGYKAGYTLKLILPFLKAYGVTDSGMEKFSAQNLVLIPQAKETLEYVRRLAYAFIVSTSYNHYIKVLCQAIEFPFENTYCTKLNIDKYRIAGTERSKLKKIAHEIARMPVIEIPPHAKSLKDLSDDEQRVIQRLDEFFWHEIAAMNVGRIYVEVDPVGGVEKAAAVKDVIQRLNVAFEDVMYVGDSITDEEAFKLVTEHDGLTVSFNGNQYAVKNAEIAVQSESSIVTAVIADVFCRFGKKETLELAKDWRREALERSPVERTLLNRLFALYPRRLPKVNIITSENMENLARESSEFRTKVRGEAIGRLG
jgi:energy-converting hydrogenase A subunit R